MTDSPKPSYVSRAGSKLAAALEAFAISPAGWTCADLGSNVGGFVDCLLQRGAQRVYAVDTGYGVLAYRLRIDPRVVVLERTNAMHVSLPEPVDLVTIDVAWTPQHRILPPAQGLLKPDGRIISLIKPHYEADRRLLKKGILDPTDAQATLESVCNRITEMGLIVRNTLLSPLTGQGGNVEYLGLIEPSKAGR